eukprot:CAMPEP_0172690582 /NCGR_PEP_ID=MMETSP1074-20121228/23972_1 /TAXON_ID=2916 /ORGANISM="Ceratium fusus, Strain PA161109" /LENGTH=166 /DNA_ID=CAMNT_0013510553 /DNA_START=98 /DNA_END=598 /DNA_ORIENTATION=-
MSPQIISKKIGPPISVASVVTHPVMRPPAAISSSPGFTGCDNSPSDTTTGIRNTPLSLHCGPDCFTTAPRLSTATSRPDSSTVARTSTSPSGWPLSWTTRHLGVAICSHCPVHCGFSAVAAPSTSSHAHVGKDGSSSVASVSGDLLGFFPGPLPAFLPRCVDKYFK